MFFNVIIYRQKWAGRGHGDRTEIDKTQSAREWSSNIVLETRSESEYLRQHRGPSARPGMEDEEQTRHSTTTDEDILKSPRNDASRTYINSWPPSGLGSTHAAFEQFTHVARARFQKGYPLIYGNEPDDAAPKCEWPAPAETLSTVQTKAPIDEGPGVGATRDAH